MGHHWEQRDEAVVPASVEEVWEAIATGPGIDSWFMGRNEVEPGPDGVVRTLMGGGAMDATITGWEPQRRLAHRVGDEADRFVAFEYLIEGRDSASTVLRLVSNGFLPGDDWEDEFEAMKHGGAMYFATLVAYLSHFSGRTAQPVTVFGPPVSDWPKAWGELQRTLGLSEFPQVGDQVQAKVGELPAIDGVVDFVNPQAVGIRTPDALYRFVQGFYGSVVLGHHLFAAEPTDVPATTEAWQAWLTTLPA